jgi:hypothetical protein
MTETVDSLKGNLQAASSRPRLEGLGDSRWLEHARGRAASEEYLPILWRLDLKAPSVMPYRELGTPVPQVVQQRGRDLVSQGQPEHAAGLPLPDAQASGSPFHVIQREMHDLAAS